MRRFLNADDAEADGQPAPLLSEFQVEPSNLDTDEREIFDPALMSPSGRPDIAMLYVHDDGVISEPPRLRLTFQFGGHYEESKQKDVLDQVVEDLSVSSIAARRRWGTDFDVLRSWWKSMPRLTDWMRRLTDAQPAPRLLVLDTTRHQIPWELYYDHHPDDEARSTWLGAELEIVRWATTAGPRATAPPGSAGDWLLMESAEVEGGVGDVLPSSGPAPVTSMKELLVQLRRDDLRFALLMLHGPTENPTDGSNFRFGGIALNHLEHAHMPALRESKAVVLLNGCNTAKFVPIGEQVRRGTTSFTSAFLRKGASSVIATLSEVGVYHARDFVDHLLYSSDEDRRLGHLLREWRRIYVDRISGYDSENPEHSEQFEDFFHGFMYVCYGHPDSTLRVPGAVGAGA